LDEFPAGYEWDPRKARTNLAKHGVPFAEVATVFDDPRAQTIRDAANSQSEDRFLTIGRAGSGRLLAVAHSYRGDRIRVISARPATQRERNRHDQDQRRFTTLP
jgi:uncharacterized DUF497 family protein